VSAPASILAPRSSPPLVSGTFWTARLWCIEGIYGRERWRALSVVDTYNSDSPATIPHTSMCIWAISCVAWCDICNRVSFSLPSLSPYYSPLGPPILTLAPGRSVSVATEVQYCTSEHALLSLPAHHRQLGQTARPAGTMCSNPHNHDLQALAVRCAVLSPLRPHVPTWCLPSPRRYIRSRYRGVYRWPLLESPLSWARLIKTTRFITRHSLPIVWHQNSLVSQSQLWGNVFG
jgi:hypothetical protein